MSIQQQAYTVCKNKRIEQMLYIRMLFSALVDADYTVSAEHNDVDYIKKSVGTPLNVDEYLHNLSLYRAEVKSNNISNAEINSIRDLVYEYCIMAAKEEPGFYTLTAPTGTGKTLALLAFALTHAKDWNKRRIIIVLPYLSIIEQNAEQYERICQNLLEDHSQSLFDEISKLYSDRWSADVIVTTSVKFFEGLFKDKPTECRRLHNISDSVIVFDEAQSLPYSIVGSTIETVNALCQHYNCTVLFSTATQPAFFYRKDLNWNAKEIIQDIKSLYKNTKRVELEWRLSDTISFEAIAEEMSKIKTCCTIVNMKKHSAKLFQLLQQILKEEEDSLFHISTDMCIAHRKVVLKEIKYRLKNGLPCRLISTQCIEAGVDLDFPILYRALAPLDAIVQSAGRCNRNGILKCGKVIVFIPDDERYPDTYYRNAANKVKLLASEIDIDIHNPSHLELYYSYLYEEFKSDKTELVDAINRLDFAQVSQEYKLISNEGNIVIVPYVQEQELFNEIAELVRAEGLTPEIMNKSRPLTVNVYGNKIEDLAERLFYKTNNRFSKAKSNWYLLLDSQFYDSKIGLQFEQVSSLETVF